MLAVFKREVKAYFYSPIAYVLIGFFVLLTSIFFVLGNIGYQMAEFNSNLATMGFTLIFIVPILTMRSIAEDRKNGTEVLLFTSPASLSGIVIGKYLAALFVFLVMTAVTFIFPIILFIFGKPALPPLLGGYTGFILMGAAFISIGVFASSLTENQIVAAVGSFVGLLVTWIIQPIAAYVGGIGAKVLNWFSLTSRYDNFNRGIFELEPIVYYISFVIVFVFLTIRVMEKRRWSQG